MKQRDAFELTIQILQMLSGSVEGYTTTELAEALSVTRQTVLKYIQHLQGAGYPLYDDNRRWFLDSSFRVPEYITPAESELISLLLERSHEISQSHNALHSVLKPLAERFGVEITVSGDSTPEDIFESLVLARNKRRVVEVVYQGLRSEQPVLWHIKPFQFVMPVWSDAVYLLCLGYRPYRAQEQYLTLKLTRIMQVKILPETFAIPDVFVMNRRRKDAWSVWQSDDPPVHVVLRFAAHLHRRLAESRWHSSQTTQTLEDGMLKVTFEIGEVQEMIPWIRSWGADVEVIEPAYLRRIIQDDARRALQVYGSENNVSPKLTFWAKYRPGTGAFHLLEAHLLDVAAVASSFWDLLPESQQYWITQKLSLSSEQTKAWIVFLAAAHDIGKASPGFQDKAPGWRERISVLGLLFKQPFLEPHGSVSAYTLSRYLRERHGIPKAATNALANAVGSHHGIWINPQSIASWQLEAPWLEAEYAILDVLSGVMKISAIPVIQDSEKPLVASWIAGFVSLSDWLGSQETYFPYVPYIEDYAAYFDERCNRAKEVLLKLGFYKLQTVVELVDFDELFGFSPNLMQRAIVDLVTPQRQIDTIVVEAPTGDGKTEIALYLAQYFIKQLGLGGAYIAMPTRATSNQLYQRTMDFLSECYPGQPLNYQLIHGNAEDHPLYQQLSASFAAGNEESLVAAEWFLPRKRSLLAQFAVGTVDQAMLAVLSVKHFFVRLFALSHKVVIVDEVHAYDTYMSTIIDRLLSWLRSLGSPIILLSATLPSATRTRLLGTNSGDSDIPYPRASVLYRDGSLDIFPLSTQRERSIQLQWIDSSEEALIDVLEAYLVHGGCAAIVCNTVAEAQHLYSFFHDSQRFAPHELGLFHSRFPSAWRDDIEQTVVGRFGKHGERPHRSILIATQIIEQSLDLDFDLMITSTAPIDLLIQRFGRLHRHPRHRPDGLKYPTVLLREPLSTDEGISFGRDEYVYEPYVLLVTYQLMKQLTVVQIPGDTETLIETVYQDGCADDEYWPQLVRDQVSQAYMQMKAAKNRENHIAKKNIIPDPNTDTFDISYQGQDATGDEAGGRSTLISTRLMEPSVRLLCLHLINDQLSFSPDEIKVCDLSHKPDHHVIKEMLRHSVTVQHRGIRQVLLEEEQLEILVEIGQLRDARAVIFEDGQAQIGGYSLKLTREFGLVIGGNEQ